MILKRMIISLCLIIPMLAACDMYEHKKNFSLSSVPNYPGSIKQIKEIWFFCERCLRDNECKPDNIKQCKTITIPSRDEALSLAVTTANTEVVYFLVNKAKANVNGVTGEYNETPLIIAAYYGTKKHKEIAKFLLSHGANINATDLSSNSTALLTAIWKNNIDFAKFLLENGADPFVPRTDKKNYACEYAMWKKQAEIIPYIAGCCSLVGKDANWMREVGYLCP